MLDEQAIMRAAEAAFKDAANDTLAAASERIFIDGKNSKNSKIGSYDTKPFYANADTSPVATNKTGKTGNTIKGGYYQGGYKEYRSQQGRESAFINFRLSNDLQSDFNNSERGFKPSQTGPLEFSVVINRKENIKKIKGQEQRFGKVFTEFTKEEEKLMVDSFVFNLNNNLRSL